MTEDEGGRARILSVARRCFARFGFDGTSTRMIANEADVAQSLILYHFSSKDELWRSVMVDGFKRMIDSDHRLLPTLEALSPKERFKARIRNFVESTAADPDHHRLMVQVNSAPSDRLNWVVDNYIQEFQVQLNDEIRKGQAAGFIVPLDPTLLYYSVISLAGTPFIAEPEMDRLGANKSALSAASVSEAIFSMLLVNKDEQDNGNN